MKNFYYHYHKEEDCLILVFDGQEVKAKNVICYVNTHSEWSEEGHPRLKIVGECKEIRLVGGGVAVINN